MMHRFRSAALAALLLGAALSLPSWGEQRFGPIRFAPLPLEEGKVVYEQFRGLMDYLAEATERPMRWEAFEDYGRLIAAFREGQVDLAYLGPLPYVILHRECAAAEPLCCFRDADGAAAYTCSLVVSGDGGLAPDRLKGLRVGLTQPYSTCGWLATSEMLAGVGTGLTRDGNRFEYAGSHSRAALGVVAGHYDAAGVKTAIARRYAHLDLKPVLESRSWPGFLMVANRETLDADIRERLRRALLALDPEARGAGRSAALARRLAGWGAPLAHGTLPPERCDSAAVAEALERLPGPIPGMDR